MPIWVAASSMAVWPMNVAPEREPTPTQRQRGISLPSGSEQGFRRTSDIGENPIAGGRYAEPRGLPRKALAWATLACAAPVPRTLACRIEVAPTTDGDASCQADKEEVVVVSVCPAHRRQYSLPVEKTRFVPTGTRFPRVTP